jgi:response regulator RpfG family c-di-GMP phosphodiesterase/DNA-directed RNA polymerase subunit RPC12/RpoP
MELSCKNCSSRFRATVQLPLAGPVRVACPSCGNQVILKPVAAANDYGTAAASAPATRLRVVPPPAPPLPFVDRRSPVCDKRRRIAAVADEPRPFRSFLADQLRLLGFEVVLFESGDPALEYVRSARADLAIVNVYLKGKLGVEVSEEIKAEPTLDKTRVILIGALFRANRFRANPTNLYGADEYIEEQIPEREFRQIVRKLFPDIGGTGEMPIEPPELDEARRLARLILSDIIIYNTIKVERGIRDNNFFDVLRDEITEGRHYFESRVPQDVRRNVDFFTETLQQFVDMKREEMERLRTSE